MMMKKMLTCDSPVVKERIFRACFCFNQFFFFLLKPICRNLQQTKTLRGTAGFPLHSWQQTLRWAECILLFGFWHGISILIGRYQELVPRTTLPTTKKVLCNTNSTNVDGFSYILWRLFARLFDSFTRYFFIHSTVGSAHARIKCNGEGAVAGSGKIKLDHLPLEFWLTAVLAQLRQTQHKGRVIAALIGQQGEKPVEIQLRLSSRSPDFVLVADQLKFY